MSEKSDYIDRFINFYTDKKVIERGKKLYANNAILETEYDSDTDTYIFKIQGTKKYTVKISNLKIKNLSTSCTCPYNFGVICKHTVASLLFLKDHNTGKKITIKSKPQKKKISYRKNESIYIDNYNDITFDLIKNYADDNNFYDAKRNYRHKIFKVNLLENEIVFTLKESSFSYYYKPNIEVTVRKLKDKLKISTTDTTRAKIGKLKKSEIFCLLHIAETGGKLFDIYFNKIKEIKKKNIKPYGLELKDFDKYFKITYNVKKGLELTKKTEGYGLVPINEEINRYNDFLKEFNKPSEPSIFNVNLKNKTKHIGFCIYFNEDGNAIYQTISAKINKAKNKLISGFQPYFPEDLNETVINKKQKKIIKQIISYEDIDEINEYTFNLSKKIFNNLCFEPFVFLNDNYNIFKKNLKQITLNDTPVKVVIFITKSNEFLKANIKLKINNSLVDINKIDKTNSGDFIICFNNIHYHFNSYKDFMAIVNFGNGFKIAKDQQDLFFDNIIKPLSKDFEIIFDQNTYQYQKIQLDYKTEQVFLSEKENHIIIQPQVVYDNDIAVLLTSNGNYLHKTENLIIEYERNTELENDFVNQLATLHPNFEEQKPEKLFYLSYDEFTDDFWFYKFFEKLNALNIEIYGLKNLKNFKYSPFKGKVNTSVKSNQDWFDVNVDVTFGDIQVKLSDVKKAIINKEKYIQLNDGSVGILPEEWLHKLEKYFRQGELKDDKISISKLKYSIIDELFDNIDESEILEEIIQKRKKIAEFKEIKKTKVPSEIKATLRDYQKEGLNWLNFLNDMGWGGILADDMGLGKTLQILTFIQHIIKKEKTANLIVLPTSLLFNWKAEVEKFAPKLKTYFYYGVNRDKNTEKFKKHNIVFTTYGILLRDIEFLSTFKFNYVILDESQAIKNPSSRRYKAANLIKANNRIALTGTPIENSTFDLYAQMNFVNPGMFGNINNFKQNYSIPIDKEGNQEIATELQKIINPFILRRTKEKVATELPPKIEDILYCEMEPKQRKIYDAYRNSYRDKLIKNVQQKGLGKSKLMVLKALTRLRQICDSPNLISDISYNNTSIKIQEIINHITQKTANHKILIFSQFVGMLNLIKKRLEKLNIPYEYLDGKSNSKNREKSVNNFQNNKDLRVFLISLKAGGTGLNLTAADYVYIVDPWWNPAVENQAIDRCYRIGQAKTVFAYRMICKDTIEEKIINLQNKKKKLATDIIQTDENMMKNLTINDINELFG